MEEKIYNLMVSDTSASSTSANSTTLLSGSLSVGGTSFYQPLYPYTWGYSWPVTNTVYMYDLKCPRCKTRNWGQLDQVIACKKCTAKLKAVSQEVDFEIPV